MQTVWKGSIAFGLVSIPVRLVSATEERDVQLRQVHKADGGRIKYRRFCSVDGEEVPYREIAKGYELGEDDLVVLTDEDMANLPIASTKAVEVLSFADRDAIDPIALSRAYFAAPTGDTKPYRLLHDTLVATDKVAIVKLALRQRERLATIRPQDGVLVVHTMLWPDELRKPQFDFMDESVDVRPQELEMATMFVNAFERGFDPDEYHDDYREALHQLVDAKVAGHDLVRPPAAAEDGSNVIDLMDALRASVERVGDDASAAGPQAAAAKAPKSVKKPAARKPAAAKKPPARKPAAAKKTVTRKAAATKKTPAKKQPAKKSTARRKTA